MDVAALIAWIVTAIGGLSIVGTWLVRGGARRPQDYAEQQRQQPTMPRERREPLGLTVHLLVPHAGLAVVGLLLWIAFTADDDAYGLVRVLAPLLLLAVAVLGVWMFRRWTGAVKDRRAGDVPERGIPNTLVLIHGLAGVVTLALVVAAVVTVD